MKYKINNTKVACLLLATMSSAAYSANWLELQGTEPSGQSARAKVWGFVQPEYARTSDTKVKNGPWKGANAIFNQNGPDLKNANGFNVKRARIGVRGTGFPLDEKSNYFILAEFGNNGITRNGGGSVKITDASVTLNHIPGARVRVGQFKYPGSEEALQAIHVADYNNFTNMTNQLSLERYFDGSGATRTSTITDTNKPNGPVGAFRDIGVQVFDTFKQEDGWEYSYAVMVGNGNGIARGDNNSDKDAYFYVSAEDVYAGKGPRRQGLKLFAWTQNGERTLTKEDAGDYDRKRSGLGLTFREGKYRVAAEYMTANGMIFNGTDGAATAGSVAGSTGRAGEVATWNIVPEGKAKGYYLDFGYKITPKIELDVRYDYLDRLTDNAAAEREFTTTTLGAQYFLNKKSRLTFNYEFRDIKAPGANATAQDIVTGIDDRVSAQLLFIF